MGSSYHSHMPSPILTSHARVVNKTKFDHRSAVSAQLGARERTALPLRHKSSLHGANVRRRDECGRWRGKHQRIDVVVERGRVLNLNRREAVTNRRHDRFEPVSRSGSIPLCFDSIADC
eukprot:1069642-Prymnesium_polylepis.1